MTDLSQHPAPLTPADCSLKDWPSILIEIERLRRSTAWRAAKRNPELGFYMMNLWMAAWHEVPAGSLENVDDTHCDFALCETKRWPKVREQVMRGWLLASDGRLYHPTVAEKALEQWLTRLTQRLSSGAGNAKKWNGAFDPVPIEAQIAETRQLLTNLNPNSMALHKRRKGGPRPDAGEGSEAGVGDAGGVPPGSEEQGSGSQGKEKAKERERKGKPSTSEPIGSAAGGGDQAGDNSGKKQKLTDPDEIIFGFGVPLLVNAGNSDKHSRSFLGGLRKVHGDSKLIDKLRECARAKPLQPLEWLAAALPPPVPADPNAAPPVPDAWWRTDAGIQAQARAQGMPEFVQTGNLLGWSEYTAAVWLESGDGPWLLSDNVTVKALYDRLKRRKEAAEAAAAAKAAEAAEGAA